MGQDRLPIASGEQHARAFERCGWTRARRRGSHIVLTKAGARATLSIPDHHEVKRAVLAKLIKSAELTENEYLAQFARR